MRSSARTEAAIEKESPWLQLITGKVAVRRRSGGPREELVPGAARLSDVIEVGTDLGALRVCARPIRKNVFGVIVGRAPRECRRRRKLPREPRAVVIGPMLLQKTRRAHAV